MAFLLRWIPGCSVPSPSEIDSRFVASLMRYITDCGVLLRWIPGCGVPTEMDSSLVASLIRWIPGCGVPTEMDSSFLY